MRGGRRGELRLAGEMGARVAAIDWGATPLGDMAGWSDALRRSLEMVMASGFPMSVRWGPELITIYNDAYIELLGDKHPAAFGRPLREVWPEISDELGPLSEAIVRGERAGFFARDHLWRVRRYGQRREDARFTISYSPIADETAAAGIGGILAIAVETTDQVRGEQALRSRNRLLATEVARRTLERDRIWQVSEDLLGVSTFEGYFTIVNPAWTELLGWSEDEIKGLHVDDLRHPDDAAHSKAGRARLAEGAPTVRMENRFRHKDGSWRWLAWTMATDGDHIYVIGRHITAQKEAEEALRDSELHFRLLVDGVTDYAIYMLDPNGIVSSWNLGAERITGYRESEVVGRHFSLFYAEDDRAAGLPDKGLARAAQGRTQEAEGWRRRKDGSLYWASVTLGPIHDADGELVGFVKVTRDITERRYAQEALQKAQERLAQSQRLEALGQFTGAVAHDFNNLLMVVGANAQSLRRRLVDPAALRAADAIELAAGRGEMLTRRLLTFARRQALNAVTVDLGERLAAFRDVLVSSARTDIELVFDVPLGVWPILVDVPELELALVNIVVNARDAMPDGGQIRITARNHTLSAEDGIDDLFGEFVSVAVADTGLGIDPAILPRVFEPFFTTKAPEKGSGLGLSQVYGFAKGSHGTARVISEPGSGTTVALYLPRSADALVAAAAVPAQDAKKAGGERVLLVEDNLEVQNVTASFLEDLGYDVCCADNASEALTLLAANDDFSVVFSDIAMPGPMNGVALAHRVRRDYPRIAILLTTGYAPPQDLAEPFPILRKPYGIGMLSSALRDTLDRTRATRS